MIILCKTRFYVGLLLCVFVSNAYANNCEPDRDSKGRIARSHSAIAEFKRSHPCPATGKSYGACKGYIIDHIQPLCACGADNPSNMQWQTIAESKIKDREERKLCSK